MDSVNRPYVIDTFHCFIDRVGTVVRRGRASVHGIMA
jgi:hypothetical protein